MKLMQVTLLARAIKREGGSLGTTQGSGPKGGLVSLNVFRTPTAASYI